MRQKISTLIEPALYRRVKVEAARTNKQISEIVGEALEQYLGEGGRLHGASVVGESWGALRVSGAQVKRVLEEEEGLLDP